MPKWGIFNASLFLNEQWAPPFFISKLKFSYDKYSVDEVWTKIYCQFYFRGITLSPLLFHFVIKPYQQKMRLGSARRLCNSSHTELNNKSQKPEPCKERSGWKLTGYLLANVCSHEEDLLKLYLATC